MNEFEHYKTPIEGLLVVERRAKSDKRGFLQRLFCQEAFGAFLGGKSVRQINHTLTRKSGTIRGLHFQYPPRAEKKIITCLKGKIWDVAVDLRQGSSTYLKYYAVTLSGDARLSFLIPEGFAHGFQALTHNCELIYLHTEDYSSDHEGKLNALDPQLSIDWPLIVSERSDRDICSALLSDAFEGLQV